ncbi:MULTISPECIES: hypothetical protein [unclassified Acinetobacter]|uniref:hypothetical protein n=1 Tax=unclassified Acinetobacter TaxID=196816 RepID=UPI0015D19AC8|nr:MULTISPECIES: hypothetical protein [unclassified Acinetobacter]UUS61798.1 hypothetical protein MST17_05725 [Acinetobacter sp. YH16056_T]
MIDPYFFKWDQIGFPKNLHSIVLPENIKVYMLSSSRNKNDVFLYRDRAEFALSSARDDSDVIRLFTQLASKLEQCFIMNEIFDFYDSSEIHRAHTTKIDGKDTPVYRIRKASIRLYLVLIGDVMVLFRLAPKRKDKIDASEKSVIDERVKAIFKYPIESHDFLVRLL